ncbi:MAG: GAF domain-containing protein [Gemmatimonadaceae bacterium]|nr:GAF domain-containing protein [Gemmatimonadaceae bacterium]
MHEARELLAVREVAHAFLLAEQPGDVQQFALDRVTPLLGAQFSLVMQLSSDGELLRPVAQHEWPAPYRAWIGALRVRVGDGPSGIAVAERRLVEVVDLFAQPELETWHEVARELGFRSILAAPLETVDGPIGAVAFYFADPTQLSEDQRTLVRLVADQLAAVTDKVRRVDALRRANAALADANAQLEEQAREWSQRARQRARQEQAMVEALQRLTGPMDARDVQDRLRAVRTLAEHAARLLALPGPATPLRADEVDPRTPLRTALERWRVRAPMLPMHLVEPTVLLPTMVTDAALLTEALELTLGLAACGACTADGEVQLAIRVERGFLALSVAWRGQPVLEPVPATETGHVAWSAPDHPNRAASGQLPPDSPRILQVRPEALEWAVGSPYATVKQAVATIDLPLVRAMVQRLGGDLRLDAEAGPDAGSQEIRLVFPITA